MQKHKTLMKRWVNSAVVTVTSAELSDEVKTVALKKGRA